MAQLSIRGVLEFYDGTFDADRSHSSALNALLGEELGLGLLCHYLRASTGEEVVALQDSCTQGTKSGVRLDRWVHVAGQRDSVLYQVEIKNWCAHSLDGQALAVDADDMELTAHAMATWRRYWDAAQRRPAPKELHKVLTPMRAPARPHADRIEPVACVWDLLSPDETLSPWFGVPASGAFERLRWFSMSSYLRMLMQKGDHEVDLPMPSLEARLAVVARIAPMLRQTGSA